MKTLKTQNILIDGYAGLLANLSTRTKLDLISKLTASVKTDLTKKQSVFKRTFGALDTQQSAETIIEDIRNSRITTRQIEPF